jgi:hypothetical protein
VCGVAPHVWRKRIISIRGTGRGMTDHTGTDERGSTVDVARPGPNAVPRNVDRLRQLAERETDVTVGDLIGAFGASGHAPLLMIVSGLMIVPVGMIPGVGGALGLLAAAIGAQMIAGRDGVWVPRFVRRRSVSGARVTALADKVYPVSVFLARRLDARWEWLAAGRVSVVAIGVMVIVAGVSLLVVGAIPVLVPLLGLPIAVFAIGLMAQDGAVVAGGYLLLGATFVGIALL